MLGKYYLLASMALAICEPSIADQEEEKIAEAVSTYGYYRQEISLEEAQSILEKDLGFIIPTEQIAYPIIIHKRSSPPFYLISYQSKSQPISEEFCQTQVHSYRAYVTSVTYHVYHSMPWYGYNEGNCIEGNKDFFTSGAETDEEMFTWMRATREWIVAPSKLMCDVDSKTCEQIYTLLTRSLLKHVVVISGNNIVEDREKYSIGFCFSLRIETKDVLDMIPQEWMTHTDNFQRFSFCVNRLKREDVESLPLTDRYVITREVEVNR